MFEKKVLASVCIFLGSPRVFGAKGGDASYPKGAVLDIDESREVEFKSLVRENADRLPWKILEKAKDFACGYLNCGDEQGIIYFGIGDSVDQKYKCGEVLGLEVGSRKDEINKHFQTVLNDHLLSDVGPLQKGDEQRLIRLEFVPVTEEGHHNDLYVVEIEVARKWSTCEDRVYYSKYWEQGTGSKPKVGPKKGLKDLYTVHDNDFRAFIRTSCSTERVRAHLVDRHVRQPLRKKWNEIKRVSG